MKRIIGILLTMSMVLALMIPAASALTQGSIKATNDIHGDKLVLNVETKANKTNSDVVLMIDVSDDMKEYVYAGDSLDSLDKTCVYKVSTDNILHIKNFDFMLRYDNKQDRWERSIVKIFGKTNRLTWIPYKDRWIDHHYLIAKASKQEVLAYELADKLIAQGDRVAVVKFEGTKNYTWAFGKSKMITSCFTDEIGRIDADIRAVSDKGWCGGAYGIFSSALTLLDKDHNSDMHYNKEVIMITNGKPMSKCIRETTITNAEKIKAKATLYTVDIYSGATVSDTEAEYMRELATPGCYYSVQAHEHLDNLTNQIEKRNYSYSEDIEKANKIQYTLGANVEYNGPVSVMINGKAATADTSINGKVLTVTGLDFTDDNFNNKTITVIVPIKATAPGMQKVTVGETSGVYADAKKVCNFPATLTITGEKPSEPSIKVDDETPLGEIGTPSTTAPSNKPTSNGSIVKTGDSNTLLGIIVAGIVSCGAALVTSKKF